MPFTKYPFSKINSCRRGGSCCGTGGVPKSSGTGGAIELKIQWHELLIAPSNGL
jgi:hypothetical protein